MKSRPSRSSADVDASLIHCAVALDVGGTKIAGGIVTPDGTITNIQTIPTLADRGGEAVFDDAYRLAERLLYHATQLKLNPSAIGISLCELVDNEGTIVSDATIRWRELAVQQRFSRLRPTVFETDSRAAARGEARYGAGKVFPQFLYVTIGTGISCSLVVGGEPHCGARGITGTMASGPLTMLCGACGELSPCVVEHVASGPAIARRYNDLAHASISGSQSVLAEAERGEPLALDVVRVACESAGSVIALLVSVLDPHAVVIGGGLGSAPGLYFESLQAAVRRHIWSDVHRQLPIVQGVYGNDAALVGAAQRALTR